MKKGIIYVMTTAVSGLVKIGKTTLDQFKNRMNYLEANGYYNVTGLSKFFAIEVTNYEEKETLLKEIFSKHRVAESELFALDKELVKELLLAFEGKVVYPENVNPEREFQQVAKRRQGELFSFYKKGIQNGEIVTFIPDPTVQAKVVGEREVEYQGKTWKLSGLVRELFRARGQLNKSESYQGANYFSYQGKKLKDLPNVTTSD